MSNSHWFSWINAEWTGCWINCEEKEGFLLHGGTGALLTGAPLWPTGWLPLSQMPRVLPVPCHSILFPLPSCFLCLPNCPRGRKWVLWETLQPSSHFSASTQAGLNSFPPSCIFPFLGSPGLEYPSSLLWHCDFVIS